MGRLQVEVNDPWSVKLLCVLNLVTETLMPYLPLVMREKEQPWGTRGWIKTSILLCNVFVYLKHLLLWLQWPACFLRAWLISQLLLSSGAFPCKQCPSHGVDSANICAHLIFNLLNVCVWIKCNLNQVSVEKHRPIGLYSYIFVSDILAYF